MRLSVMLFPLHKQLSDGERAPAEVVEAFQAEGIGAVEPALVWIESEPALWAQFDDAVQDAGLVHSCLDVSLNLVGENDADRAAALDRVAAGVEFCCKELGCSIALLAGTRPAAGMSDADGRRIYGHQLAAAAERTRGSGVVLTIEDFGMLPTFTASAAGCLETLEAADCPAIKFTFDNGNFLLGDDRPTDIYPVLRDRTVHVHIKDFALCGPAEKPLLTSGAGTGYNHALIGNGEAEVAACLRLLKADGYDGWISLEAAGDPDPLEAVVQGARFVRRAWDGG